MSSTPIQVCIKTTGKKGDSNRVHGYPDLLSWTEDPDSLYIGKNMEFYVAGAKKSKWANPFQVKKHGEEGALVEYEKYVRNDKALMNALHELAYKNLGCWCTESSTCHASVLIKLYEELPEEVRIRPKVVVPKKVVVPYRPDRPVILFYSAIGGKWAPFSNFYEVKGLEIDGSVWPTTEHYFQAEKFNHPSSGPLEDRTEVIEEIRNAKHPNTAAKLGRKRNGKVKLRSDWEQVKMSTMIKAVSAKFYFHPELKALLLSVPKGTYLVEHTTNDKLWADGGDKGSGEKGENWLGKILTVLAYVMRGDSCAEALAVLTPGKHPVVLQASTVKAQSKSAFPPLAAMTLTFGDSAENHVNMQKIGDMAEYGFSFEEMKSAMEWFTERGVECELVELHPFLPTKPTEAEKAWVLIARNGLHAFGVEGDELFSEHIVLPMDTKALMRGKVVNKHARYNLCYADFDQEPDYEAGKGRIVAFSKLPLLNSIREQLGDALGPAGADLQCEMNYYYDSTSTGIGFHGDSERRKVVAVRLGKSIPLHYQWFERSKPIGERIKLVLNHGDMYVMSEKAVGTDWKRSSIRTLRHAAGSAKFTTIVPK